MCSFMEKNSNEIWLKNEEMHEENHKRGTEVRSAVQQEKPQLCGHCACGKISTIFPQLYMINKWSVNAWSYSAQK